MSKDDSMSMSMDYDDLPACTCPSYQTGAVDGTEMCQFGDNCSLGTNFGDSGCPPNAIRCVMDIPESSDESMDYSDSATSESGDSMSMSDYSMSKDDSMSMSDYSMSKGDSMSMSDDSMSMDYDEWTFTVSMVMTDDCEGMYYTADSGLVNWGPQP